MCFWTLSTYSTSSSQSWARSYIIWDEVHFLLLRTFIQFSERSLCACVIIHIHYVCVFEPTQVKLLKIVSPLFHFFHAAGLSILDLFNLLGSIVDTDTMHEPWQRKLWSTCMLSPSLLIFPSLVTLICHVKVKKWRKSNKYRLTPLLTQWGVTHACI